MKRKIFLVVLVCLTTSGILFAQEDTLPKFSAKNVGNNRIIIGWTNMFQNIKQISVQRSFDSLTNFKTILTVPDPTTPQNGFADTKATNDHMFYRLYIMLDKGVFLFSQSKRPVIDTVVSRPGMSRPDSPSVFLPQIPGDSSVLSPTINTKPKPAGWVPSRYVFTNRDGYIRISLPDEVDKNYNIKFFTNDDEPLFELKDIKEKSFRIDKANFYKAGWFKFELYENGELKEKNKFYLQKEF
jgi:hypothetical protein